MEFNQMLVKKKSDDINVNFEGQIIAVKQYLPIMEKYYLAQGIINSCMEEDGKVVNYVKKDLAYVYDIINAYTDIDLTSADTLEETADRYDAIVDSGLFDVIISNIPEKEINIINTYIESGIMELQKFKSSPMMVIGDIANTINSVMQDLGNITPDQISQITETLGAMQENNAPINENEKEVIQTDSENK